MDWIFDFLDPDSRCLQQDQEWGFLFCSWIRIGFGFCDCWKKRYWLFAWLIFMRGPGPALAGAGPNARPRRGAPLSSGFMTSSCSVNRAIRPLESADISWKKWTIYLNTMARGPRRRGAPGGAGPMQLHRLHWLKTGPGGVKQESGCLFQCFWIFFDFVHPVIDCCILILPVVNV